MNRTASTGTEAADDRAEAEADAAYDRQVAPVTPGRYVAGLLRNSLSPSAARELGRLTKWVRVDDLEVLGLVHADALPTIGAVDTWCVRNGRQFDIWADAISQDELRAIVTGHDPRRQVALSTLQEMADNSVEWAAQAVTRIRDGNTAARAKSGNRRPPLHTSISVAVLLSLGVDNATVKALPTADQSSTAASVKIIEAWTEEDRTAARRQQSPTARFELIRASDIKRQHIDWLWTTEGRDPMDCGVVASLIPLHGLTLLAGREQAAKSLFSIWLAAQVSHGRLPGHYLGEPRDVVILATEDTQTHIRMRLEAAGADMGRVHVPVRLDADGNEMTISVRDNLDHLADVLAGISPGLVILDPLRDFLGGVDTDKEQEVRPVLTPLLKLTQECGAPVLGLHHLNKSLKGDFLTRLSGSGAFKNVARSVLGVGHHEETGTRVLEQKKGNLAAAARGAFSAHVEGVDIKVESRTEKVGRWVMDGLSEHDLDAVLAAKEQGGRGPSERDRATALLQEMLRDGPQPRTTIMAEADRRNLSESTLKRAMAALDGDTSSRDKKRGAGTIWSLPTAPTDTR